MFKIFLWIDEGGIFGTPIIRTYTQWYLWSKMFRKPWPDMLNYEFYGFYYKPDITRAIRKRRISLQNRGYTGPIHYYYNDKITELP